MADRNEESRAFDLGDILTITTGSLVSPRHIGGVYDLLGFMTGDTLFTHQLPRAAEACRGPLLEQLPLLAEVVAPEWRFAAEDGPDVASAIVFGWLDEQKAIYGAELPVAPLTSWHHVNPIQELAELTERPDRIIVVSLPATPPGLIDHG